MRINEAGPSREASGPWTDRSGPTADDKRRFFRKTMMRSMFSGVTGLQSHQTKMDVIGDNIANVNTVGFKGGRITFQELISQTMSQATPPTDRRGGINPMQIGMGVGIGAISTDHSEGSLESTGGKNDLAILGNGYFVLNDGEERYYTRAGAFDVDSHGNLVNSSNGYNVQGWAADLDGRINTDTPVKDLTLPLDEKLDARASTEVIYTGNLKSGAEGGTTVSEEMIVYDSLGEAHRLTFDFEKKTFLEGSSHTVKTWMVEHDDVDLVNIELLDPGEEGEDLAVDYTIDDGEVTFEVTLATDADGDIITTAAELERALALTELEVVGASGDTNVIRGAESAEFDLDLDTPSAGDFTLTVNGEETGAIAFDADADTVRDEIRDVLGVTDDDLIVTGSGTSADPFNIVFEDDLANQPIDLVADFDDLLDGVDSVDDAALSVENPGQNAVEEIRLSEATDGSFTLSYDDDDETDPISYDASITEVQDALVRDIGAIDAGDISVTGSDGGPYRIEFLGALEDGLGIGTDGLEGTIVSGTDLVGMDVLEPDRVLAEGETPMDKMVNEWLVTGRGPEDLRLINDEGDEVYSWTIEFDERGKYDDDNIGHLDFAPPGASMVEITPDFGRITQFAGESSVDARETDGYAEGTLESYAINTEGIITGVYTNGLERNLGRIALANFSNPEGLFKEGDTLFSSSSNSGEAQIGPAGRGGRGIVSPGDLEMSNIDLAQQFTDMIITQRGFQANSRTITTTDQMLQELTGLIR